MIFKDYYKILGLETNKITIDDIKNAYREQAKKYHPDVNVGNKNAEERFKDINEAYNILSNPTTKKKYDRTWNSKISKRRKKVEEPKQEKVSTAEEVMSILFGATSSKGSASTKKAKKIPVQGEDVETEIQVSIEDAFYGKTKKLSLRTVEGKMKSFDIKIPEGYTYIGKTENNEIKIKDNKNNLGKDIYTNYCFKIYKVNNHKTYKIYKSININKDHPIYVNLYSNKSNVYGKTENRIISNDINLDNDHIRIYINVYYINMEKFIYSVLKHELTHVVEMYSAKKFNNINNLKNTIGIDKDNDIMLDINPLAKNMLNRMVYLFSNTEHNAHINGLAEFINKLSPTEIKKYTKYIQHEDDDENIKVINNINNPIYNFMRNYDDLDILTNYQEFEDYMFDLKSYLENNDLLPIFYLGYLL